MLAQYGWSDALQRELDSLDLAGLVPGRVTVQQRGRYRLATADGDLDAEVAGRLRHRIAAGEAEMPVAGDWVAAAASGGTALIQHVLPRRSAFTRLAAGPGAPTAQVVAANVETAFLTASLNADLNLRRLERYLATAYESGAAPVFVLTKADLCPDVEGAVETVEAIAFGAPVIAVSAVTGGGLEALRARLAPGETAVVLGSSGVGKSTLVNALAGGAVMATGAIREDDARGRHTTTHRELILLPGGGLILDTPGMRELALWDAEAGVSAAYADLEALFPHCRFRDCAHRTEPGCAVQAAIAAGELDEGRLRGWRKLQREVAYEARKDDPVARSEAVKVWIRRAKANRARKAMEG